MYKSKTTLWVKKINDCATSPYSVLGLEWEQTLCKAKGWRIIIAEKGGGAQGLYIQGIMILVRATCIYTAEMVGANF